MKCINKHMHRNWYIKYLSLECISYIIKYVHKQINKYDCLSKIHYCTHWHINLLKLLLCLCVWFYSSFLYTCVCVFLHIQSPSRECRSIRSGASGLPYYCAPLVCVSEVMELLAVWRHNKPKTKNQECVSTTRTYHDANMWHELQECLRARRFRATFITATLSVCVPDVIGVLTVWIQTQKKYIYLRWASPALGSRTESDFVITSDLRRT